MAADPTVGSVSAMFSDGVESVEQITSDFSNRQWEQPVCGRWTATQTARHLVAVARWYHEWLDRAVAGDASPPFTPLEMDERNEHALAGVGDLSGPEAISEFAQTAAAYLARAVEHWGLAYGYPYGTATVGLHCGVAAAEWHLHAWDLSRAAGRRHQPQDPKGLFAAAGSCLAAVRGGSAGVILRLILPLGARIKPWETILKRSGRTPNVDTSGAGGSTL